MADSYASRTPPSPSTGPRPVVPQKLRAPSLCALRRTRLESRLLQALETGHVLIVAPPGAGKTTLLSQVAAATGLQVAWYSAGAEESDATVLVHYLARALRRDLQSAPPRGGTIDELLAAIGDRPQSPPLVLVVDDIHELAGSPAEETLERFLECCPPHLHVLLGSRRPPGFNAPRMMASGNLVQFDHEDLRFRSWEVEELFRDLYSEPLSPETAALLTRRVGGFAAALQLFHLSTRGCSRGDRESNIRQLSGRSPLIRSYLTRTVIDSLTAERRDFLVRTSVLDILRGPLCDALLGRSDSATVLRELEDERLFTTSHDGGLSYQYHPVLRNHLEVTLEDELPAGEVERLRFRAAELLEGAGYPAAALVAYQRAGDWGSAGRLVRRTHTTAETHDPGPSLPGIAPGAPDDPWLNLARARGLLRSGAIDAGIAALERLERSVDDPDLVGLCAHERRQAALWQRGPLRSNPEFERSALGAIRLLTHSDVAWLPSFATPPATAEGHLVLVLSKIVAGEFTAARAAIEQACSFPEAAAWVRLAADLIDVALELTESGAATRGAAQLEDLGLTADVEGYPWLARLARGLQACVLIEQTGELWHRHACDSTIDSCVRDGDHWGELLVRLATGVALARLGVLGEARTELEYAAARCRELDAPVLGQWVECFMTVLRGHWPTMASVPRGPGDPSTVLTVCRLVVRPRTSPLPGASSPASGAPHAVGELGCLGGFRLLRAGRSTDLTPLRPRARLLLMNLAIQYATDVHREYLIEALWPGVPLSVGVRRLQVAVSSVRQLLEHSGWGSGCLLRRGHAYRLQLAGAEVDLEQLEAKVTEISRTTDTQNAAWVAQESASLIELYRGELLPEVGSAEWVLPERDRLRLITTSALAILTEAGLRLGRPDLAQAPAQRLVELDPFRDTAWLMLARIQRSLGDHNAADLTLAAYHRVSAQLH